MSADSILVDDLLQAAGHFVAHALNRLPEGQRTALGDAVAAGGIVELRIIASEVTRVAVGVANRNGEFAEAVSILCGLPTVNDAPPPH